MHPTAQLQCIRAGLMGFSAEVKTVSFLPEVSPFRVQADADIFGTDASFSAAVERVLRVITAQLY